MTTFEFNQSFSKEGDEVRFINPKIEREILSILLDGPGYLLIRGFPVSDSTENCEGEVLDFSFLFGVPVSQTLKNEFICKVQDEKGAAGGSLRGYQHSGPLPFHSDRCDLLMLFGLQPSKIGGETMVVSSKNVQQRVSTRFPSIYDRLQNEQFPFEKRIGGYKDVQPWYTVPIFSEVDDGKTLLWYCRGYIEDSQKYEDCPKLGRHHIEALNVMDEIVDDPTNREQVNLQRGDILLLNCNTTLHARNGFPKGSDRLLLRIWLSNNNYRLPTEYSALFGNVSKGSYRGGLWTNELNLDMIPKELSLAKEFIKKRVHSSITLIEHVNKR